MQLCSPRVFGPQIDLQIVFVIHSHRKQLFIHLQSAPHSQLITTQPITPHQINPHTTRTHTVASSTVSGIWVSCAGVIDSADFDSREVDASSDTTALLLSPPPLAALALAVEAGAAAGAGVGAVVGAAEVAVEAGAAVCSEWCADLPSSSVTSWMCTEDLGAEPDAEPAEAEAEAEGFEDAEAEAEAEEEEAEGLVAGRALLGRNSFKSALTSGGSKSLGAFSTSIRCW
jgi:hypothetical protein